MIILAYLKFVFGIESAASLPLEAVILNVWVVQNVEILVNISAREAKNKIHAIVVTAQSNLMLVHLFRRVIIQTLIVGVFARPQNHLHSVDKVTKEHHSDSHGDDAAGDRGPVVTDLVLRHNFLFFVLKALFILRFDCTFAIFFAAVMQVLGVINMALVVTLLWLKLIKLITQFCQQSTLKALNRMTESVSARANF